VQVILLVSSWTVVSPFAFTVKWACPFMNTRELCR
jgi:hypothetical protein